MDSAYPAIVIGLLLIPGILFWYSFRRTTADRPGTGKKRSQYDRTGKKHSHDNEGSLTILGGLAAREIVIGVVCSLPLHWFLCWMVELVGPVFGSALRIDFLTTTPGKTIETPQVQVLSILRYAVLSNA